MPLPPRLPAEREQVTYTETSVIAEHVALGIAAGDREILVDDITRQVKWLLSGPVDALAVWSRIDPYGIARVT